jgi:hypothetical protein
MKWQGSFGSLGCVPTTVFPRTKKSTTSSARSPSPGTQPRLDPTRHWSLIAIHSSLQRPNRCPLHNSGDIISHPFRARKSQLQVFSYRQRRPGSSSGEPTPFDFGFNKNKTLPRQAKWSLDIRWGAEKQTFELFHWRNRRDPCHFQPLGLHRDKWVATVALQ